MVELQSVVALTLDDRNVSLLERCTPGRSAANSNGCWNSSSRIA